MFTRARPTLLAIALLVGCGDPPPPAAAGCPIEQCGITCFDPDACGSCGNAVCDWTESLSVCPSDCCDAAQCNPAAGEPYPAGDAMCAGAADGKSCDDGNASNGAETCRAGACRHEHAHCLCMPPGGIYARDPGIEPAMLPPEAPTAADPPWSGPTPAETSYSDAWGLRRTDVSRAWARTRGSAAVRVGIVDTGCDDTHSDLAGRVVATRDFTTGDPSPSTAGDHGTFLANVIAGAHDGTGSIGVAPDVSLVCARVLRGDDDDTTTADPALVAQGIDWVVSQGAQVVLVGLASHGSTTADVERAVRAAITADVVVIAPSGSLGGANADGFPAALPGVISVGASDRADLREEGSDLAPTTLLLAPGHNIVGSYRGNAVGVESGSSVAAALAAGAAALIRSAEPTLRAPQVRALLHAYARPVPLPEWEDFFDARRIDIGESVTRASPGLVNAAVAEARFVTASALPGGTVPVRVRVENRGVADARDVRVSITVTGGTATTADRTIAMLGLGTIETVTFDVTPATGATEVSVSARAMLTGDTVTTDDSATTRVPIAPAVQHRVRIARAWIDPPMGDVATRTVHVRVENAGNVAEPAGELRVVAYPKRALAVVAVPALAPAATTDLVATVALDESTPDGHHVIQAWILPARGQRDLTATSAAIQLAWRPGHSELARSYMQHKGYAIILDAPWRTIRDKVPVLVYYAQTQWEQGQNPEGVDFVELVPPFLMDVVTPLVLRPFVPATSPGAMHIDRVTIANPPDAMHSTENVVYDDERPGVLWGGLSPDVLAPGAYVTDENGVITNNLKAVIVTPALGAHRLVWLPRSSLNASRCGTRCADNRSDPLSPGLWLRADVSASIYDGEARFRRTRTSYRVMFVGTSNDPFPSLHGTAGQSHYFDPHFHSIAETWPGTYALGPAKAFGGPLEMLVATAWSLGLIPQPRLAAAVDRIITTDHNTFFDDEFTLGAGPTAGSTQARTRTAPTGGLSTGSPEMDRYRALLGLNTGEEVSLKSRWGPTLGPGPIPMPGVAGGVMGNHTLLYRADYHVNGTWGTADVANCTPDVRNFLTRMSGRYGGMASMCAAVDGSPAAVNAGAARSIGGFTFAAHPFTAPMFDWDENYLLEALSVPPFNNLDYIRALPAPTGRGAQGGETVMRGLQFWNAREAQKASMNNSRAPDVDERHQNPYWIDSTSLGPWEPNCGDFGSGTGYRADLGNEMAMYLSYVRDGMSMRFFDAPEPRPLLNRKIFTIAGSDAHGDFNWTSDLLSTRIARISLAIGKSTFTDSAFARPRTYVFSRNPSVPATIEDMRQGRAVLTDGPVVELELTSEMRGSMQGTGYLNYNDFVPEFRDPDGFMGGSGVYDAEGTMFVPYIVGDRQSQRPGMRMRCTNLPEFGGATLSTAELFMSGNAGTDEGTRRISLDPAEYPCDGAWHSQSINLDEPISTPVAILAHVATGDRCPGIYDAITNPVWVVPVTVNLGADWILRDVDDTTSQRYRFEGGDVVELEFPISMADQRVQVTLVGINSMLGNPFGLDGTGGAPAELIPSPDDGANANGWAPSRTDGHPNTRLRFKLPASPAFESTTINPVSRVFRMLLTVRRDDPADGRLRDIFENPIDDLIIRFRPNYVEHTLDVMAPALCCGDDYTPFVAHPMPTDAVVLDAFVERRSDMMRIPSGFTFGSTTFTYTQRTVPDGTHVQYGLDLSFIGSGSTVVGTTERWRYVNRWRYSDAPDPMPPPPPAP